MNTSVIVKESNTEDELRRMMSVCNACRYCEGFCAVFPAITQRRNFTSNDLTYLSNLCHNCNACYHGCQYVAPHEFDINIPKKMAEIRGSSYQQFAWPQRLSGLFEHSGLSTTLAVTLSMLLIFSLLLVFKDPAALVQAETGPGSFYRVITHQLMVISAGSTSMFALIAIGIGLWRFWRHCELENLRLIDLITAFKNVAKLTYLGGDQQEGCNDVDDSFSNHRRYFHQGVMWGFMMCFASTCVATFYDYYLELEAPYGYLSIPVLLGTIGGIGMLIGCVGLWVIKLRSDPNPRTSMQSGLDYSFIIMLFLSSASGLILLVLRETSLMPILLALHLAIVLSLFVMLPYSKFVHAGYRFIALIKFSQETNRERQH